jgi:hypothetical protein
MKPLLRLFQLAALVAEAALLANQIVLMAVVADAQVSSTPKYNVKALPLPGADGLVMLDYFAYDTANRRLWVPAGNTGSVDVIDAVTDRIKRVEGFSVQQVKLKGKLTPMGLRQSPLGRV